MTRQGGEVQSSAELVALFNSYDWKAEHNSQSKLLAEGQEACPAGLSIVREEGVFLHLCPNEQSTVMTHCIHLTPRRVLGFFKATKKTHLFDEKLNANIAVQAISKFLSADEDWLSKNIKRMTS